MGKNTFKLEVMGQTKSLDIAVSGFKFIATLERPGDYAGEFGFDWMRFNYNRICENYEKLKKEYTPAKIEGDEYFVPWLSMFPNQEGVKLQLYFDEPEGYVNSVKATEADVIKLPPKGGIRFEPDQLTLKEVFDDGLITVFCDQPLTSDITIDILNRDDKTVGKLNVYKNAHHKKLHFNINPVRILRKGIVAGDKTLISDRVDLDVTYGKGTPTEKRFKGFGDKNTNLAGDLQTLETYLNTQCFNQALVQCSIGEIYDVIIDEDKWIADDLILDEGCIFKGSLLGKFEEEFKKQHPKAAKQRGMTVFLSPLNNIGKDGKGGAGGYANMGEVASKNCAIFYSNLFDKTSFAHEIAHVAGLEHFFIDEDDLTPVEVVEYNARKLEIDSFFDDLIETKNYTKEQIGEAWSRYSDEMRHINSKLYTHNRNLYKFEQKETDNFMDYYNERIAFNKFQWKALGEDIIKFYNS